MKISFCITCMNRLHHLSNTLGNNIREAAAIGGEVVVLNYGSTDGLDEWIKSNWLHILPYFEAGNFRYFHTKTPQYFFAAHAKNVAHKLASGNILCNLDADNYLVSGYSQFLYDSFSKKKDIIVVSSDNDHINGVCGKIAVTKDAFYGVNGYDESQSEGWGWDDTNFQFRVRTYNELSIVECPAHFNQVILHSIEERVANYKNKDIFETQNMSIANLNKLWEEKRFVANIGQRWGSASVVDINGQEISI